MFKTHQTIIGDYAKASPDNLARVLKLVVISIQTQFFNCEANLEIAENNLEGADGILYGWKLQSFADIDAYKVMLWEQMHHIAAHSDGDELAQSLINLFGGLTGLGMVKAGFVAQLVFGVGGCLDTNNIKMYGISPNKIHASKLNCKPKARSKNIADYVAICNKLGGAEALWDKWCMFLAKRDPSRWADANAVSAYHCQALGLAH